jgi:hypothetical protein
MVELPYEIIRKILSMCDDLDIRIHFKVKPRRLAIDPAWRFRNPITYDTRTKTLYDFEDMPYQWVIRKNIPFSGFRTREGQWVKTGPIKVFNVGWLRHPVVMFAEGFVWEFKSTDHCVVHKRLVFK